jgi:ribonuclease HI
MSGRGTWLCYTDGSCKAADGAPGGWGFVVRPPGGEPIEGYGKAKATLAKVMEYRAVAEALEVVPTGARVVVFSDNQSLVAGLTRHLVGWRERAFSGVDPLTVESVRRIDASVTGKHLTVEWRWIRSHNGNAGNERADALAAQGAREARAELAASAGRRPR